MTAWDLLRLYEPLIWCGRRVVLQNLLLWPVLKDALYPTIVVAQFRATYGLIIIANVHYLVDVLVVRFALIIAVIQTA